MKGLLWKDIYTIQCKLPILIFMMVLVILIPILMPELFDISAMMLILIGMVTPVSSMAYDEKCRWDSLQRMYPYTSKDIVLEKYLMGYAGIVMGVGFALLDAGICALLGKAINAVAFSGIPLIAMLSLLCLSLFMPVHVKFGAEKGMLAMMITCGVCGGFAGIFTEVSEDLPHGLTMTLVIVVSLAVIVVLNVLSVRLSMRIYRKKEV
ncbi:MAG: ABC-2 transporter permease [Oscillospiraceae bacterium]|jgi:hypothetical protein|nr:ABC-2 transporter permease [Oscillospiraceae bacterium]